METIWAVFGAAEVLLLLVALVWCFFAEGMEVFIPMALATRGSAVVLVAFLVTVFVHDHIHFGVH